MASYLSGGVPPSGEDFNGILNALSALEVWLSAGGAFPFDSVFSTAVGGYPKGARVMRSDATGYWLNTADNNAVDPETSGGAAAGWVPDITNGIAAVALAGANVTLSPLQYGKPIIALSGTLTANVTVILPNLVGQWLIVNNCTGAYTVTCETVAGTGVLVAEGSVLQLYGNATNIYTSGGVGANALTASGYEIMPSGRIRQWGVSGAVSTGASTGTVAVTFPIPFPNACFTVIGTPDNVGASAWSALSTIATGKSQSGVTFICDTANPSVNIVNVVHVMWEATGW
jgi:hypothetical protein